ncbi:MAG: M23 family metallopeptidase [Sandaracinus sp.]|nr:M23 family metallopeptidase [Sandaracinus sp.]
MPSDPVEVFEPGPPSGGMQRLRGARVWLLRFGVVAFSMVLGALAACLPRPTALASQARRLASHVRARPASMPSPEPEPKPTTLPETVVAPFGWMDEARRCGRRGRRRFCDGPRRVPRPHGEAEARAARLELGTLEAFGRLRAGGASAEMLADIPDAEEKLLWPVPRGFLGRGFGYVRRPELAHRQHRGVDIPAPRGAEVRAANAGLVVYADNGVEGYGNFVVLLHADDTRTAYAHLREARVFAGQIVERGHILGEVGTTGLSYAPHLHFEWWRRAVPRNPTRHFAERPSPQEERRLQIEAQRRREAMSRAAVLAHR